MVDNRGNLPAIQSFDQDVNTFDDVDFKSVHTTDDLTVGGRIHTSALPSDELRAGSFRVMNADNNTVGRLTWVDPDTLSLVDHDGNITALMNSRQDGAWLFNINDLRIDAQDPIIGSGHAELHLIRRNDTKQTTVDYVTAPNFITDVVSAGRFTGSANYEISHSEEGKMLTITPQGNATFYGTINGAGSDVGDMLVGTGGTGGMETLQVGDIGQVLTVRTLDTPAWADAGNFIYRAIEVTSFSNTTTATTMLNVAYRGPATLSGGVVIPAFATKYGSVIQIEFSGVVTMLAGSTITFKWVSHVGTEISFGPFPDPCDQFVLSLRGTLLSSGGDRLRVSGYLMQVFPNNTSQALATSIAWDQSVDNTIDIRAEFSVADPGNEIFVHEANYQLFK